VDVRATGEGAVVGVVSAVLLLPVTFAARAVSYEGDARRQMNDFWSYIYNFPVLLH
jgi:hypothetical protein